MIGRRVVVCVGLMAVVLVTAAAGEDSVRGYLARGQVRTYTATMAEGETYHLRLTAPEGFILALFDPDGNIVEGRYVEAGFASIVFISPISGEYVVKIGTEERSGNYKLSLE
jgi:hypothetical protein